MISRRSILSLALAFSLGGAAAPAVAQSEQAPPVYKVKFETSKGNVVVEVHRDWAPKGAERFYDLVRSGFYDDARFFRVISGFMAQFGINGTPQTMAQWRSKPIADDAVKQSNTRGRLTFAMAGPNTRTTQVFINYADNSRLDTMGFAPIGEVVSGMGVIDKLYAGYGEGAPRGSGPDQMLVQQQGNAYLQKSFPKLDYIKKATIEK
jgi:peptidyl-prolyl cis-trans isomerase A (cyclophilin A)